MLDFDKFPPILQFAALLGTVIGGALLAWFGSRVGRNRSPDEDQLARETAIEIVKLRDQVRDNALRTEFHLVVGKAKETMGEALSATRESFEGEFQKLRDEIRDLETRLRELEIGPHRRR